MRETLTKTATASHLCALLFTVATTTACPPSTQGFCIDAAKASCQLQFQCCTAVERQQLFGNTNLALGPYSDEGGCVEVFTRQCEANSQAQDEAIAAGRLSFDQDRANECVQKLKDAASECDAGGFFGDTDDDCDDLVSGEVKDGDTCFSDAECAEPGSECEVEQNVGDDGVFVVTLEGTCKGQGDDGEPCLPGNVCNEGLRCLQNPETFEFACAPPLAAGGRCSVDDDCEGGLRCAFDESFNQVCTAPAPEGGACDQDADCVTGLRCLFDASSTQVCQVPGGLGVSCNSNDECIVGLLCAQDPTTFRSVCSTTSGQGESCASGVAQCEPGLDCRRDDDFQQRCFAGQIGDPCANGERCLSGLTCRNDPQTFTNTCQAALGAGDDCDRFADDVCDPSLRCIRNASFQDVCSPPLDADEPCEVTNDRDPCDLTHHCAFDETASENICVSRLSGAAVCDDDVECGPGLFCDDNAGTCAARRNENQSCTDDGDCNNGLDCRANDAGNANICRSLSDVNEGCVELKDCVVGLDCRFSDDGARRVCRGASVANGRCEGQGDCAGGLDCRDADDNSGTVCRGVSGEDEGCEGPLDCSAGLECRFDNTGNEVCTGPADAGEACGDDSDCVSGLVCRFDGNVGQNVCRAFLVVGDTCLSDSDCTTGLRCRDLIPADEEAVAVCTDKLDNGSSCEDDAECISGFCDGDGAFCTEPPPERDFEICDGL